MKATHLLGMSVLSMMASIGLHASAAPHLSEGTAAFQPKQTPSSSIQARPMATVEFAESPYRIESIGLSMQLPAGSTTQLTRDGSKVTARVLAPDQTWIINIESRETTSQRPLSTVVDAIRDQILGSVGVLNSDGTVARTMGRVIDRQQGLSLKGGPAERVYVQVPGPSGPASVKGYTVFNPEPERYITFELLTPEPAFAQVRPLYETVIATVAFEDPSRLSAARQAAVAMGVQLMSQMSLDDYRAVIERYSPKGKQRWDRLFAPSSVGSDDQELGYKRITAWVGQRGELDSSREKARWRSADRQSGYLLKLEARVLDGSGIYDTVSMFFLSEDRTSEAWLIRSSRREGGVVATWTETGAREGSSMTVRIDPPDGQSQTIKPSIEGEGYLSRLEAVLLPDLLMSKRIPAEYGFYTYQSESGSIRLRRDVLEQPEDRSGLWVLTTRLNDDSPAQVTSMNERGDLIRSMLSEGRVWEPTQLDRLVSLWRRAGLPMD
ncbi:MAG: hypothetical protein KF902_08390 [Phycisphaeraceae bacterium]|nr:hypothetical protein [Phycisphaeraceae bacterium]MCW5767329.1 hypothetical protein [Phycisphaeraceae bacterium]